MTASTNGTGRMFRCREGTSNRGARDGETSNFVFALPFFAHLTENFAVVGGSAVTHARRIDTFSAGG